MKKNTDIDNDTNLPEETPEEPILEMWEYLNIPDFYERVRGALNVGNTLSNTTIDYFENAPMAELKIKQRVPKWKELDNIKRLLFETCIIYMTCYILCPTMSSNKMTKYKDPSLEVNYAVGTNEKPCARFMELIDDLIAQINEEELAPFFTGFMVTPSKPSWCGCHRRWFPRIIQRVEPPEEEQPENPDIPDEPIIPELPETPDSPDENTPLGAE